MKEKFYFLNFHRNGFWIFKRKFRNMYHYFIVSSDVVNVVEKLSRSQSPEIRKIIKSSCLTIPKTVKESPFSFLPLTPTLILSSGFVAIEETSRVTSSFTSSSEIIK
jgi:hypothetical protein